MRGRHDIFVIDKRRPAVEYAMVREHGHPRVLVCVRGGAADDKGFYTQRSAPFNNKIRKYYEPVMYRYTGYMLQCFHVFFCLWLNARV